MCVSSSALRLSAGTECTRSAQAYARLRGAVLSCEDLRRCEEILAWKAQMPGVGTAVKGVIFRGKYSEKGMSIKGPAGYECNVRNENSFDI
jgi:hypothetical protein